MTKSVRERQVRDLRRRIGDVAKKFAERHFPGSYVGRRHTVSVGIDADDPPGPVAVSCQTSCEACCEGPREEQGERSHADGARTLAIELGLHRCKAMVRVQRAGRRPGGYEVENVEVQELA